MYQKVRCNAASSNPLDVSSCWYAIVNQATHSEFVNWHANWLEHEEKEPKGMFRNPFAIAWFYVQEGQDSQHQMDRIDGTLTLFNTYLHLVPDKQTLSDTLAAQMEKSQLRRTVL
jgi:hypothetical protein